MRYDFDTSKFKIHGGDIVAKNGCYFIVSSEKENGFHSYKLTSLNGGDIINFGFNTDPDATCKEHGYHLVCKCEDIKFTNR